MLNDPVDGPPARARLNDNPDEFAATIAGVAERLALNPFVIEKDYWVTAALREIAADYAITFKGGTCLSKAFKITARFSEDVDLLAPDPTTAADSGKQIKKKREAVLKGVVGSAEQALGGHGSVREHGSEGKNRASHVFWHDVPGLGDPDFHVSRIPTESGIRRSVLDAGHVEGVEIGVGRDISDVSERLAQQ